MPVRPENRARYPSNWVDIARACKERAGWKCEECGVAHGDVGYRVPTGRFVRLGGSFVEAGLACDAARADGHRVIRIVLTCAHLDHQPENCADDNLRAWCQRCHLHYDLKHHLITAAHTRRQGRADGELFDAVTA